MNIDAELTDPQLDIWRQQWQSETVVPPDLRKNVAQQSRLMKAGLIADTLVTVVMGGGTTIWAMRSSQPDVVLIPVATWLFLAAAWTFVLTANRGNWTPSGLDTAAFLHLSIRRCRTALATIWFAVALFVSEIMFGLAWAYSHTDEPRPPVFAWLWFSSVRIDVVWLCAVSFLAGIAWYRKKKQRELASLLNMLAEMSSESR